MLHGATNAVWYFQSPIEAMFGHFDTLIYLDDLLGYAKTKEEFLEKLHSLVTVCLEKRLKLNPMKCDLVTLEIIFCGRVINKASVSFQP